MVEVCRRGHPRTPENQYVRKNGTKACRPCIALTKRRTPEERARDQAALEKRNLGIRERAAAGESYKQISAAMDVPFTTVKTVLARAKVPIRNRLECESCGQRLEESQARDCRACVDNMLDMWRAEQGVMA